MFDDNPNFKKVTLTSEIKVANPKKHFPRVYLVVGIITLVFLALITWSITSQYKLKKAQTQLEKQIEDPQAEAKKQTEELLQKVGQLMVLPTDEEPTIATVSDLSKLSEQEFFKNAQLGDKVIIYYKAKKAILYRPFENKIIELAPLVGDQVSDQTTQPPTTPPPAN